MGVITDNLFVNFINQKFILIFLKLYLKRLNFFNYEAIIYYPMIYPVIRSLKFDKIHFHIVDDWQGFNDSKNNVTNDKKISKSCR